MSHLFSPLTLKSLAFKNRVFVSPMCQYSCTDGVPNDWHLVHLGARAVGGAALVMTEAAAVVPEGRISPDDAGIWNDTQAAAWQRIATFLRAQGAVPAIQLAHAGRKASTFAPWRGSGMVDATRGGWAVAGPGIAAFAERYPLPRAMTLDDIAGNVAAFAAAAARARDAGFQVAEIHAAHGYLLHEFLSPLVNTRDDAYGGSLENRMRFLLETVRAVRRAWPDALPLFVRISASDWAEGGWDLDQSIVLCQQLRQEGVDLIDVSSGGAVAHARVAIRAGYQVPFARAIRRNAGIATGAVGLITAAAQAEQIVADGDADAVFLARALLRDPHWPLRAAQELGAVVEWPDQYKRATVNASGS